ncbi:MAG: hypothetical protein AAF623_12410, partial [Planctomycetota bacterium]
MADFFSQFTPDPDPDMASLRSIMISEKPLLRHAVVAFALPYPDYPKLKLGRSRQASADPSCPSARDITDKIVVTLSWNDEKSFGNGQEVAGNFIKGNASKIENVLRRKLFAQHQKALKQFLEEILPNDRKTRNYWNKIENEIDWQELSAVDYLYKLVGVSLLDHGLDACGFSSFEFQSGWDRDHGISVLTHRCNTLAAGGMGEFTFGSDRAALAA